MPDRVVRLWNLRESNYWKNQMLFFKQGQQ